jgi:hypothetical protein
VLELASGEFRVLNATDGTDAGVTRIRLEGGLKENKS